VKQKRQASAAFLGVMVVPRKVVGVCCILTTILTHFGAFARPDMHSTTGKAGLAGWPLVNRINFPWPEGLTVFRFSQQKGRSDGAAAFKHEPVWRAFERSGFSGSLEENASKQKIRAPVLIQSEPKRLQSGGA
jgi:hypothetical protein